MNRFLLSSFAFVGLVGTAVAADLPVKAPPIVAPVFNWTGCYVGGYVGGAWTNHQGNNDVIVTDTGRVGTTSPYNTPLGHQWGYELDSSVIGGGTAGCNWQPAGWSVVFGLEGEGGYLNLEGTGADPLSPQLDTVSSTKIGDWYGMITGRLGFAFDRLLLYGKGGVAFVDVQTSVVDACNIGQCGTGLINAGNATDSRAHWTGGAGVEWAFDMNWSVKAEYMFIDLNNTDSNYRACGIAAAGPAAGATFCWDHDLGGIHTAKIGINYRFGGGAPVVARY